MTGTVERSLGVGTVGINMTVMGVVTVIRGKCFDMAFVYVYVDKRASYCVFTFEHFTKVQIRKLR